MAVSTIKPLADRLITPERSEKVSPITATATGVAAATTPAMPVMNSFIAWFFLFSLQFLPHAPHYQKEKHQG
jgi:hypothetical protein